MSFYKTHGKVVCLLAAILLSVLLAAVFAFGQNKTGPGFVGSEACKECHEAQAAGFPKSLHAKALAAKGGDFGCESCHGPAGDHVGNPTRDNIISFGRHSKQNTDVQSRQCLDCHSATTAVANWDSGMHRKNDVSCSSCHGIHRSRTPVAAQPETCFSCHTDIRYQANKRSHHPIIEGKVKCSDCHNPHGSLTRKMLTADSVNLLCYKCHAEKRGPFLHEHPPVAEDCLKCHESHGTKAAKLLTEKVPNLCQDCHDASFHPGTPYDAKRGFTGSSPSNKLFARACLNCHGVIHGSYAPEDPANLSNSGRFFLR